MVNGNGVMPGSHNLVVRMPGKHVVARPYGFWRPLDFLHKVCRPKIPYPAFPLQESFCLRAKAFTENQLNEKLVK